MTTRLVVKSKKQHIRLWFEFLKICFEDPRYQDNLKKSAEFYAPWGDVRGKKFDEWWHSHHSLFATTEVKEIEKLDQHPDILNVAIPLTQSITKSIEQTRVLIRQKQDQALLSAGLDPSSHKSKTIPSEQYETTRGVEIRGRSIHEDLILLKIWLMMKKPAINKATVQSIQASLRARPRARWVPTILADEHPVDISNTIRQLRRRLKRAEKICLSVSKGEFPGKNSIC